MTATSEAAIGAAAPDALWPLPDWLREVEDNPGFAWAMIAWRRAAAVPGAWYDAAKAEGIVLRFPKLFKLTMDRFAGVPFVPNTWQAIVIRLLFGWKKPTEVIDPVTHRSTTIHVRIFRQLRLWIPRKNGKSEFLAALALLFFLYERIVGAEGYCFARDEEQGKIPFRRMKAMVAADPTQAERVRIMDKAIWVPELNASFQLLPGKADGKHGRAPTVIFGDEMHEWLATDLADTLREGTGNRLQPIELYASTAGLKTAKVGYQLYEESIALLEGKIDDPSVLVVHFAAPDGSDWRDETTWRIANPTIGLTPTWDYMRGAAAKARGNPRAEANFKRYHLNLWVDQLIRWLPAEVWNACAGDGNWKSRWDEMKGTGRRCWLAADVSRRRDMTALFALFEPGDDGIWKAAVRFWLPQDTFDTRCELDRAVPWRQWKAEGAIELTPGNVVDQAFLQKAILDAGNDYDVALLGFDPWNAAKLMTDLQAEGVSPEIMREMRQGHRTLAEPTAEFESRLFAGLLDHGGHPVLAWQAGHCQIRFDENMNFVPAKKRSGDNIDGIAAGVMATGLTMVGDGVVIIGSDAMAVA